MTVAGQQFHLLDLLDIWAFATMAAGAVLYIGVLAAVIGNTSVCSKVVGISKVVMNSKWVRRCGQV